MQEETGHFLSIWAAASPATCPVPVLGPTHARPLSGASAVRQRSERRRLQGCARGGGTSYGRRRAPGWGPLSPLGLQGRKQVKPERAGPRQKLWLLLRDAHRQPEAQEREELPACRWPGSHLTPPPRGAQELGDICTLSTITFF